MIHSRFTEKRSVYLEILTNDQIWEIRRAALDVMRHVGFKVLHKGARKMLKQAGAVVEDELVKVPEFIVEQCLGTAPKGWTIFDRQGRRAMEVEGRKSYYGTSTASPNTQDALTGEIHPTRVADIVVAAGVADALENIDWVMPMGSSQDVPALAADIHEFEAVVAHTTKPIVFIGYSPRGTELVLEMAAEVAGGLDRLRERPFVLFYPEPISPLVQPEDVLERMFIAVDHGIPQVPGPAVSLGATGPVTLAGTIAQITAEALMSLVLVQLRNPGCPCCLSGNVQVLDMATGLFGVGYPEMSLGIAAQAEVARSFGLPTWGYAGCTDAKVVDAQAGMESGLSILSQGLAGLNLIHDVGYMDMAMVCSTAQLVLGNEAIGWTKRFIRGIEVNRETVAREVIEAVGPGGHFLQQRHTVDHLREELWRSRLLTRQHYSEWQQSGAKDMYQRIRERLREIIDHHQAPTLPAKTLSALQRIRQRGEKELTRQPG
jgi:trimethylamine--corrinoid protein Co-methyltransferase